MRQSTTLALCLAGLATTLVPARAAAQPPEVVAPPARVTEQTTTEAIGPSMPLVVSGIVIFGVSYAPAVVVGSTSSLDADRSLLVPFAGPWINLVQRPACSGDCNAENANRVLIVTDGVFQAVGGLTTLAGFLFPAHRTTTVRAADGAPTWHVSPTSFGRGGYGLQVAGSF